jgi:uncharacterized membrane protein YphA (DoxX/SURF4 family)
MMSFDVIKASEQKSQILRGLPITGRLTVGGFFFVSGVLKIINDTGFREALSTYGMFSSDIINIIGLLLPLIEITVGLLFAFGFKSATLGKLIICMLLVFSFTVTIALGNNQPVDCGCFPVAGGSQAVGFGFFIRNGILILLSIYVVAESSKSYKM